MATLEGAGFAPTERHNCHEDSIRRELNAKIALSI